MKLATRIAKLEMTNAPKRSKLWVVRFEGPGSEHMPQPTQEELNSAAGIFTARFLEARDDRGSRDHVAKDYG